MNSGNYSNVPGSGIAPHAEQQRNNRGLIQHHVAQILQQQQIPPGWQSTIPLQQRLQIVLQLISSIRLIKSDMDITRQVQIAIDWELKVFMGSPDQATYDHACRSKLTDMAQTRSRQAVNIQEQLRNPQPPQMNMMQPPMQMPGMPLSHNPSPFQFAQSINPHFQQPQQNAGMPIQQPFMHQQQPLVMGNQQMGMQNMPHQQIPPNHAQPHFTIEDQQAIQRLAHTLAVTTPKDQLEIIRHNLQNMQPDQRQFLIQQNLDPISFFFRSHATRKFLEQRGRLGPPAAHDLNVPANAAMPQQPRPPSQNSLPMQPQQAHPTQIPPSQPMDPSFGGNMDQILGQQQEALRSQEAGQVVVPASQQRGNIRNPSQQLPNALLGGNQVMQNVIQALPAASQYWGNPQMLQGSIQPGHIQAPPHTANFANISTPAQLQGQMGGLSGQVGRAPQQPPNMPNLNKGLKDSPQTQNRWHQQRVAQPNQPPDRAALGVQQATLQPGAPGAMDAAQQKQRLLNQQLANMSPDQRREFMINLSRRSRAAPPANTQVNEPAATHVPDNPAGQQMSLQDVAPNTIINNADGAHDPAQSQQPPLVAGSSSQQATSQRAPQAARQNAQVVRLANILSEEQAQQMDQFDFPITILHRVMTLPHLPPNIKTWGQLKSWVSQKNNELPHELLTKIRSLQGLHYQTLFKPNNQSQQAPQVSAQNTQGVIRPAPIVHMVPGRGNGQQGPAVTGVPLMLPPTIQEIQAFRASLPENRLGLSDEQISRSIFKQRQDTMKSQVQPNMGMNQVPNTNRQRIYPPGLPPQHIPTANNQPITLVQPGHRPQYQQNPPPAGNISKEQQAKQPSLNRNPSQTQNQGQTKGTKRVSNDDVVEVVNPTSVKQETQAHPMQAQLTEQVKPALQQNASEQFSSVHAPKQPVKAEQTVLTNQSGSATQSQLIMQAAQSKAHLEAEQRKIQLQQMFTEVGKSMPTRPPLSLSPQIKAKMMQKLLEARSMVLKLDNVLPVLFRLFPGQKNADELVRMRILLVNQYGGTERAPIEQLTITSEELDVFVEKVNKCFLALAKLAQRKSPNAAQSQTMAQQPPGFLPAGSKTQQPPEAASLSAANLKEHQKAIQVQRQASVQKSNAAHGGNRAPAAPTSPQAPFHFGSPDWVPSKYPSRTDELTQERLRIPPKKKRRGGPLPSTTSIPAQPQHFDSSKSPQLAKTTPGLSEKPLNEAPFKCHAQECTGLDGFVSQADLDKHITDIHDPKEPVIEDPLQWTLEQMRSGLGLEENGRVKLLLTDFKAEQRVSEAIQMKKSPSAQRQAAGKQESATPMTRVPTQTGPSPGSNLLKTPQPSASLKTPRSETKSAAKDVKAVEPKTPHGPTQKQTSTSPDPWANSLISSAAISGAFSGLPVPNSTGTWNTIQHAMTPSSTLSSGMSEKTSPRVSDISENDAVKISLDTDPLDYFDWLTFESATSDDYPNELDYEIVEEMDWDGPEFDGTLEEVENEGPREGRAEDMGPSMEWLKTFAPQTLQRKQL